MRLRKAAAVAKTLARQADARENTRNRRAAEKAAKPFQEREHAPSTRIPFHLVFAADRERRGDIPVTLPPITMLESPVTDEDIDLPHDPVAQERAERFLAAAYAYQRRQAEKAQVAARVVHVDLPDEALHLAHAIDHDIMRELGRIAARPPAKWRNPLISNA